MMWNFKAFWEKVPDGKSCKAFVNGSDHLHFVRSLSKHQGFIWWWKQKKEEFHRKLWKVWVSQEALAKCCPSKCPWQMIKTEFLLLLQLTSRHPEFFRVLEPFQPHSQQCWECQLNRLAKNKGGKIEGYLISLMAFACSKYSVSGNKRRKISFALLHDLKLFAKRGEVLSQLKTIFFKLWMSATQCFLNADWPEFLK